MKKLLFISNIPKKITNFSYPSIVASRKLGIEFHLAANLSNFTEDANSKQIKLHHIDLDRNPFHPKNYKAYKQLMDLVEREHIDFIHCNTPIGGVLGRLASKGKSVKKVIYTAHGFHFYDGAPFLKNLVYRNAERYMANFTNAIITMNHEDYIDAQRFKLKNEGSVYYVPGVGINVEEFSDVNFDIKEKRQSLGLSEENTVVISVGELIKRKNYEASIKSIAKTKDNKIKLLICGEGSENEKLKDMAKSYNVNTQVKFLGFRDDIKELLISSDIFLFTSKQEGLPRATMEAMAAGLPCVVSDIRGNNDLIDNTQGGYRHSHEDIERISKSITTLATSKKLRVSMGQYNKAKIQSFDTSNVIENLYRIYKNEFS